MNGQRLVSGGAPLVLRSFIGLRKMQAFTTDRSTTRDDPKEVH